MNKLKKTLKKIINYITSPKSICIVIALTTLIILSFLLTTRYYLFQEIIEDGVSKKDVFASRNIVVVDKARTEKRREEMAQKVEPVLKPAYDIVNQNILSSFDDLFQEITDIRESDDSYADKRTEISDVLNIRKEENENLITIDYISTCSNKEFSKIKKESKKTLEKLLEEGVSEKEIIHQLNFIVSNNIKHSLSKKQKHAVNLIVKKILKPNMVIDEVATEIAKQNARNSVKPYQVIFNKNDKVISKGESVTRVQKEALKTLGYNVSQLDIGGIVGILSLVGICLYLFIYYLINFDLALITPSYASLFSLLSISIALFAVFLPVNVPVYIIPMPAIAILLTVFTNLRVSLIFTFITIIMLGLSLHYPIEAIAVFLIGGIISAFASSLISHFRRMDLLKIGFDVGLIQVLVILSIYLLQSSSGEIIFYNAVLDMSLGFLSGIFSGMIVLGSLPLIENAFKIISPYGLAELADHNQELLRRLQFEAPGTYHHSLIVSNLVEAAAEAIGANPILARVGAFYHDIGKLKRPLFFVENQSFPGIENPHEKLNPKLSKMIITAHPKDGVELAKEYKLPTIIHQFILQHHGDSIATYFYQQAVKEEGIENVSKEQFRYTGQKPTTKEVAILMLADAVESAVRSIKTPTQEEIEEVIDKIIKERLMDGQLSESPLTQKDLKIIAASFSRILRGMQHHRIKYHENIIKELENKAIMSSKKEPEQEDKND